VESFRPRVAVFLNATPDHLDRHGSFEGYVRAKAAIFARQQADDAAVLNFDDPVVRDLAPSLRARVVPVSRKTPQPEGVSFDAGRALLRHRGERIEVPLDGLLGPELPGVHNLENVLAALAAVWALGADPLAGSRALLDFQALPHRSREVARARGIRFVDDSKATNSGAARLALESHAGRALWIAGGRAKGADFGELADAAAAHARAAFLIGEASEAIEVALAGRIPATRCASIEDAVRAAAASAGSGDVVLLAPGCASFDQFANYGERGDRFAAAARAWAAAHAGGDA
jgi:UDP-N-acetylmuramoylalanine--D-glutamate ligase